MHKLIFAAIFLLLITGAGCGNEAGNNGDEKGEAADSAAMATPSASWYELNPVHDGPSGLILGFREYDKLSFVWLVYENGNVTEKAAGEYLPVPTPRGWKYLSYGAATKQGDACNSTGIDAGKSTGDAVFAYVKSGTSPDRAKKAAQSAADRAVANAKIPPCGQHFSEEDILRFVAPGAWCGEFISGGGEDEGGGWSNSEYFSFSFSTGDSLKLQDHFPQSALEVAAHEVAISLGEQWQGEPVPVSPDILKLHLSRENGKVMAFAIYAVTFELDPIVGEAPLGEAPESLCPYNEASVEFHDLREAYPGIKDVLVSPNRDIAWLGFEDEWRAIRVQDGKEIYTLKQEGDLILAEWAVGENVSQWTEKVAGN